VRPPDAVALGKRIREAREARGLDQRAITEALAVGEKTVSRWENTGDIGSKNLRKLASFLEMSVDELHGAQPPNPALEAEIHQTLRVIGEMTAALNRLRIALHAGALSKEGPVDADAKADPKAPTRPTRKTPPPDRQERVDRTT
jgi:transcriptional regulator with XRE-family HTH domain